MQISARRTSGAVIPCFQVKAPIPGAKLVAIPGAGHVGNLERPEQFNDAVREFCRAHSPRPA
jgi:pimeloyl-ACP methyl ester carboxylesterase